MTKPEINRKISKSLAKFQVISSEYDLNHNFINEVIVKLHSLDSYAQCKFGLYVTNGGQWLVLFDGPIIKDLVLQINKSSIKKSEQLALALNKQILESEVPVQILDERLVIYNQTFESGWGFPMTEFQRNILISSDQSAYKKEIFYLKKNDETLFLEAAKSKDCRFYKKKEDSDGALYEVFFTNYKQLFLLGLQYNKEIIKTASSVITRKLFQEQILDQKTTTKIIYNQIIQS
jgi:hypothetical protein